MINWTMLIITALFIIPLYRCLKYYSKTRILDYLLFSGFFMCGIIGPNVGNIVELLQVEVEFVVLALISEISFDLCLIFLAIHALRIKWDHPPKVIVYGFLFWVSTLLILSFLYWIPSDSIESYQAHVAIGFITGFYFIPPVIIFLYSYLTVKPLVKTSRMNTSRTLWIITAILWAIYRIMYIILYIFNFQTAWGWVIPESIIIDFSRSYLLYPFFLGVIIIAFIAIRYPETVIYSKAQILRAIELYQEVTSLEPKTAVKHLGIASIVDYLHSIPPEIIESL